ncbi:hypothetical protein RIVM261_065510 [Rivularia sp. IAM M-261]|nr:hypothetical protein CAL7716_052240 [Calothrix sp. PCC 7716]GJD21595.1 hypothetical protein RIVM261_065510 [Rivularia sp. IAM M-261]
MIGQVSEIEHLLRLPKKGSNLLINYTTNDDKVPKDSMISGKILIPVTSPLWLGNLKKSPMSATVGATNATCALAIGDSYCDYK